LDEEGYINDYEEYEYTDRIVRFHDPESSIKITGADEVIVYVAMIFTRITTTGLEQLLHMV